MRLMHILFISSTLLASSAAALDDGNTRPVAPLLDWTAESLERFDPSWLHVKFVEGSDIELIIAPTASGSRFTRAEGGDLVEVNRVLDDALVERRTFPGDRKKFRAWKARGEAASGQPGPDLSLWFDVKIAGDRAALADTLNALNALDAVEIAHPAPVCEPAVIISPAPELAPVEAWSSAVSGTPDFTDRQDYLYETPLGLDAPSAWAMSGGRGAGTKFIDVELGWTHMHEDFDEGAQFYQGQNNSTNSGYRNHGTAVMGEVVGVNNSFGITGFASDAQWGTVGILINEWPVVPHHFLEAAEALDPGDAWLIELQMFPPGRSATPMEWVQVNYDVIWTSSWALEVICVEAGANGSQDLDAGFWNGVFDRNVRDSGAIMVAAGTPTGRIAESFTNYGSRMDVHGWGSQIVTTGYGDLHDQGPPETEYTARFGGTSGASPMIAGSALCMQGIARQELGGPLTPVAVRQLLHDTGIAHLGSRMIGPRPDLGAAVEELLRRRVADLTDFLVIEGTLIAGGLPEMESSDDMYLETEAKVTGETSETHRMMMRIRAMTTVQNPDTIDITLEGHITDIEAIVTLYLRNWNTGNFEQVGRFTNGLGVDTTNTVNVPNAARFVRPNGRIVLRVKKIVILPFTLNGFHSLEDLLEISVR